MNLDYGYKRINKVLGSCTNRFQYLTATKYIDLLIKKYYKEHGGIQLFYRLKKQDVLDEFN